MSSTPDNILIQASREESRALVTLDKEFGKPLIFPPAQYAGIVVLRLPASASPDHLIDCVRVLIAELERAPLRGKLWIIHRGRLRAYQPQDGPILGFDDESEAPSAPV